jgi:hypothetical protein
MFHPDNYPGVGPDVFYTCHHYGTLNTEPRIASYIGIAWGQVPPDPLLQDVANLPGYLRLGLARNAA